MLSAQLRQAGNILLRILMEMKEFASMESTT
jgi:hypothetical protein